MLRQTPTLRRAPPCTQRRQLAPSPMPATVPLESQSEVIMASHAKAVLRVPLPVPSVPSTPSPRRSSAGRRRVCRSPTRGTTPHERFDLSFNSSSLPLFSSLLFFSSPFSSFSFSSFSFFLSLICKSTKNRSYLLFYCFLCIFSSYQLTA